MKQIVLSVEQMQHLQDLGVNTNDAYLCWVKENNEWYVDISDEYDLSDKDIIPAYTLQDIECLIKDAFIYIWSDFDTVHVESFKTELGKSPLHIESSDNILLNAYNTLCWCIENGYIKN